jgi:hypothetical protein
MRANKLTAKKIINALAKSDFVFKLTKNKDIRAEQKYKGHNHCPLSAYIELQFGDSYRARDISASAITQDYDIPFEVTSAIVDAADECSYQFGYNRDDYEVQIRQYMLKKFGLVEKT